MTNNAQPQVEAPPKNYVIPYPMHGGRIIGRILKDRGIKYVFGVQGGHVWPMETGFHEFGITRLHMRHEQAGVYAAEALAKLTRMPGVCYGTAGPGFTNMVSGIAQGFYNSAPILALAGQHTRDMNFKRAFQEAHPDILSQSITRWSLSIEDWRMIPLYVRKALYDCMMPPKAPITLAIDMRALMATIQPENRLLGDVPFAAQATPSQGGGDPKDVEKVVRMLIDARRPAIAAGEGAWWSDAANELREFVELLNIPVITRRMARGSVPEDHPLAIKSGYRGTFWAEADVVVTIGLDLGSVEALGLPPAWPAKAKRIVINESQEDGWEALPSEMIIIADAKVILRQMIDCAKDIMKETPERASWIQWLHQCRNDHEQWHREALNEYAEHSPIHEATLCQQVTEAYPDAILINDSFTASAFLSDCVTAKNPGSVLDCGNWGGVGHGIGMGIGAQLARPDKKIIAFMGDGGLGVGGMDIETAVRYNLPICYIVVNNDSWMAGVYENCFEGQAYPWNITKGIRYDKMFQEMGCHGENCVHPRDIKPALDRAFKSGKTSVINVMVDPRVFNPTLTSWAFQAMIKLCVDTSKVPKDWVGFFTKGPTTETMEKLRGMGYPLLKPMPMRDRIAGAGQGFWTEVSGEASKQEALHKPIKQKSS